jgi:hypothetical protein
MRALKTTAIGVEPVTSQAIEEEGTYKSSKTYNIISFAIFFGGIFGKVCSLVSVTMQPKGLVKCMLIQRQTVKSYLVLLSSR